MKILGLCLAFLGYFLFYVSHNNQNLLKTQLNQAISYLSYALILGSLIVLLLALPILVAVFMWIVFAIIMWSFLPFITLFSRNTPHESKESA